MNAETSFLYGFITGDAARLNRYLERWRAAGVQATKALCIQVIENSIQGDDPIPKLQRRLLHESLARVSWLALGMACVHFEKERNAA